MEGKIENGKNFECEFCTNKFKSLQAVKGHQKRTKYCIKIQKQKIDKELISTDLKTCDFCQKEFASDTIPRHLKTCKEKIKKESEIVQEDLTKVKDELIKENDTLKKRILLLDTKSDISTENIVEENTMLKKKVLFLQHESEIKDIVSRAIRTTRNKIYKPDSDPNEPPKTLTLEEKIESITSPMDFEDIDKLVEIVDNFYTIDYAVEGQKGLADFANKYILRDKNGNLNYICINQEQQIFIYKDINDDLQTDINTKKLTEYIIRSGIPKKSRKLIEELEKEIEIEIEERNKVIRASRLEEEEENNQ
jgi:hypothetical protein